MKIGILTHPLRTNYGGILQNYALQTTLKKMGHTVYTIDRHNDKSSAYLFFSFIKRNIQHYLLRKHKIPTQYYIQPNRKDFLHISQHIQSFIRKHIQTTVYYSSNSKLKQTSNYDFDAYIVGSDQVWLKQYAPSTFLDFLNNQAVKRIAYSASFGVSHWTYSSSLTAECKKLAKKFDSISVRELSAVDLCEKYLNVKAEHILDPTTLLTATDYMALIEPNAIVKSNFLMVYILDPSVEKNKMIEAICKKKNLIPVEIKAQESTYENKKSLNKMIIPPISKWLEGFRDSDYVLTDSFHGMIFSVIFNKQFIAIGNEKRGLDRFVSFLKSVNLENRLVNSYDELISKIDIFQEVEYTSVNNVLELERNKALEFLRENLQ